MNILDYNPDDIDVQVSQLFTATADEADPLVHPKVTQALALLRERIGLDVVFVSQFADGRRIFKAVESGRNESPIKPGMSDPLEESWCEFVAQGRVPELIKDAAPLIKSGAVPTPGIPIGTHLSTPIVLANGEIYGTLCCFSSNVVDKIGMNDLRRLQFTAKMLSEDLLKAH